MNLIRDPGPAFAMARQRDRDSDCDSVAEQRRHLQRSWLQDCDIDPMILRMRLLRHRGALPQADCLEQELEPMF